MKGLSVKYIRSWPVIISMAVLITALVRVIVLVGAHFIGVVAHQLFGSISIFILSIMAFYFLRRESLVIYRCRLLLEKTQKDADEAVRLIGENIDPESKSQYLAYRAAEHMQWMWGELYRALCLGEESIPELMDRVNAKRERERKLMRV